ncbi:hypothetical protein HRI_000575800 [Hibiscus trionum]|uniref:Uncharacterized protein n=1 Tax=Hibiscus trionum TaxID=183268 RepID=A0A9W7LMV5_HIBTR|nr:hypothetical protein HRI_000575800 [Hibiscus trionum]
MRYPYLLQGQITVAILLLMMIPFCTSHYALDSPEKSNSVGFFRCNGSSSDCFGVGLDLLMESETRRMLQQGGGRPSTNTLKPNAACNRDKFGYLCTPPGNKDVKRSENCKGSTFNRACHQLKK